VTLSEPIVPTYTIVVNNQSGVDICYLFAFPMNSPYGDNDLVNGARLNVGASTVIQYADGGGYSLYAQECSGGADSYWEAFDQFDDYTWTLDSSNQQTP